MSRSVRKHHCRTHQGVQAVAHCAQCHTPICADCVAARDGRALFCSESCLEAHGDFYREYGPPGRSRPRWVRRATGAAVTLAMLAVGLYVGRMLGVDVCDRILRFFGF